MSFAPSSPSVTESVEPVPPPSGVTWMRDLARRNLAGVRGLIVTGAALAVIYALMTLAFPITSLWYRVDDTLGTLPARVTWARPFLALGGQHNVSLWMGTLTTIVIVALFGMQALATIAARRVAPEDQLRARRVVILFAALFVALQVFMQPVTSTDLYGYLARSYLIATLHQNPTVTLATFLPGGYLVPHARPPAPYGPIWLLICGAVGAIAGENLLLAMLLMKAIMALATIGGIVMVARLAGRLLPDHQLEAVLLFAWSPLLIVEAVGNGHNDITMMIFVLASLAVMAAKRPIWAFPLLAVGVLIKYSVGALVPLWAVVLFFGWCWRRDAAPFQTPFWPLSRAWWREAAARIHWRQVAEIFGLGGAISVVLAVATFAPFWVGFKTFTGLGQQLGATYFNGSIAGLIYAALQAGAAGLSPASLGSAIRFALYLTYVGYVLWQARNLWLQGRAVTVTALAQHAGKALFATLVLVTFWYQPWYIVWLLPLAALSPDAILRRHAVTLALGGMLTYVVQYFAFVNQPDFQRGFFVQFFLVIVAFTPLLALNHGGETSAVRRWAGRQYQRLSTLVIDRPAFTNRMMLGLILIVAAMLRLIKLGTAQRGSNSAALHYISGNLSVSISDARGLEGVFAALRGVSTFFLGDHPFANLLPTALIGVVTVWVIFALAHDIFAAVLPDHAELIALLAALIAATAQWHVALSRSGAEIILLPLLISGALLAIWRARRLWLDPAVAPIAITGPAWWRRMRPFLWPATPGGRRNMLLVVAGLCIGLMSDMEPRLWPLPALALIAGLAISWRRRADAAMWRETMIFAGGIILASLPALWAFLSGTVGFAPGSAILARTGHVTLYSLAFLQQAPAHIWTALTVLVTQDYGGAGPQSGGIPILPVVLAPFLVLGALRVIRQWRQPQAIVLGILAALPVLITPLVAAPASIIVAATVLPIACLLPAIGIERAAMWLVTALEAVGEPGARMFISRENLLRVALLVLLVATTVSTFFWYFASTLVGPTHIVIPA